MWKAIKTYLVFFAVVSASETIVFAQRSPYAPLLHREELWAIADDIESRLSKIGENPRTLNTMVSRGVLLLKRAFYTREEKHARQAYEYLDEMYLNHEELHNPATYLYVGSARSLWGWTLRRPLPSRKISFLKEGVRMIDDAIVDLTVENDVEALGFAYFVRAATTADAPTFLEMSDTTKASLKTAAYYYKKYNPSPKVAGDLVAGLYGVYSEYYLARGDIERARLYVREGIKKAYSPRIKRYLEFQAARR